MKYFIAFLAISIATFSMASVYFEKKDVEMISKTYGYTNVEIKWSEGTNHNYTKHYTHYTNNNGEKCANVFHISAEGAKAQPWEICGN